MGVHHAHALSFFSSHVYVNGETEALGLMIRDKGIGQLQAAPCRTMSTPLAYRKGSISRRPHSNSL